MKVDSSELESKELGSIIKLRYGPHGHLDTPYLIAKFAGMSDEDSLWISFYSEYPDEIKKFSATGQFFSSDKEWRHFVYNKLHSLHGGGGRKINLRRAQLKTAISEALKEKNLRKAGLLIHALGDSYAHTYKKFFTKDEKAYGEAIGHGLATLCFHDPDKAFKISNRNNYIKFITALFKLLATENANKQDLDIYITQVINAKCTKDDCAIAELGLSVPHNRVRAFLNTNLNSAEQISQKELVDIFSAIT